MVWIHPALHFSTRWPSETHAETDTPTYLQFSPDFDGFRVPLAAPGKTHKQLFRSLFQLGPIRESPGGPRVAKRSPRTQKRRKN